MFAACVGLPEGHGDGVLLVGGSNTVPSDGVLVSWICQALMLSWSNKKRCTYYLGEQVLSHYSLNVCMKMLWSI